MLSKDRLENCSQTLNARYGEIKVSRSQHSSHHFVHNLVPRVIVPLTSGREERLWSNPKMAIFDWLLKKGFISCHFTGCYYAPPCESSLQEKLYSITEFHEPKAIDHCKCCKCVDSNREHLLGQRSKAEGILNAFKEFLVVKRVEDGFADHVFLRYYT